MVPNTSQDRPLLAEFRLALSTEDPGAVRLPGQVPGLPPLGIWALRAADDWILPLGVSIVLSSSWKMSYLCGWGVVCTVGLSPLVMTATSGTLGTPPSGQRPKPASLQLFAWVLATIHRPFNSLSSSLSFP